MFSRRAARVGGASSPGGVLWRSSGPGMVLLMPRSASVDRTDSLARHRAPGCRGSSEFALEGALEVGQGLKARRVADVGDRQGRSRQQRLGKAQAQALQVALIGLTGGGAEAGAEVIG